MKSTRCTIKSRTESEYAPARSVFRTFPEKATTPCPPRFRFLFSPRKAALLLLREKHPEHPFRRARTVVFAGRSCRRYGDLPHCACSTDDCGKPVRITGKTMWKSFLLRKTFPAVENRDVFHRDFKPFSTGRGKPQSKSTAGGKTVLHTFDSPYCYYYCFPLFFSVLFSSAHSAADV